MPKKVYKIIINTLIFVVFVTFMPNFTIANGPVGKILLGLGYSFIIMITGEVLHFFRLPETIAFKICGWLILISAYLFAISAQFPNFLKLGKGYIGSTDFIIFTIPRIITLDTQLAMILASAIILMLCSIIMDKKK